MRRSLLVTAAAAISMVLLAMLVPMMILVRSYALEDRLARAALEVQAVETVVSGQDAGAVAQYVDRVNDSDRDARVTVLYPDGPEIGPDPGQGALVLDARNTGRARVDDVPGGSQLLVPVSRGGNSALPSQTPVIRVVVDEPGLDSAVGAAWGLLALLALVLLAGSLAVVDRLGRSFVLPIRQLARHTRSLGGTGVVTPLPAVSGPPEVQELASAVDRLVGRIQLLLARERANVADLSHRLRTPVTALRLRVEAVDDPLLRHRLGGDLDALQATVDEIVREARRSEREGLDPRTDAVAVITERVRHWEPLAEDQGRPYEVHLAPAGPLLRASRADLEALVDVLLDNVFSHTPDDAAVRITLDAQDDVVELVVEDAGPGLPPGLDATGRGSSGGGSTGLGLSIAARTAESCGGALEAGTSDMGGARVAVTLRTA
ncbi:HAMP domain-containing sensor histidine kinase [Nocardioides sp. zg-1228]|uniref:sensor histidine kinase n=1 Tax=Nocardioides sp. zg-1228 TaxID=2763008 RepID=UPI0016434EDE|nr:HAMP domain-containing sensor histidine kinase [Nocardioides sp. zg-1228]MBC2935046.1 HAMP domain-containing histidine kinase [Nocardioides sp. zg-1228]QSF58997.1 HAMP domain-containing histidine kinase [Nocardioides sp. zg-1228]